jgi:ABC-2 type transport system ATP-binding protein
MIKVDSLSKFYGAKRALGPVSFEIQDGETVGFLGLNGAGKTTALRVLACDLRPSAGSISIDGIDAVADPGAVRRRIGFLPEHPPLYAEMTVLDYLRFAAELRGLDRRAHARRIPEVVELTHLGEVAGDPIATLSHGFRQRVGVAQAIVHDPKLLILDEPTRGLDPVQIVEMRQMIKDLKEKHTVLISSHILPEISQTCDRLLVLGNGEILTTGTEEELTTGLDVKAVVVSVRRPEPGGEPYRDSDFVGKVAERLAKVDGVTKVGEPREAHSVVTWVVRCDKDCRAGLGRTVVESGWDLLRLDSVMSELEQTFIRLVGGDHARN